MSETPMKADSVFPKIETRAGSTDEMVAVTQESLAKDQADLRRMAELFDQSADDFAKRLGEDNEIAKQERRSAELFRLAAGGIELHWAAQECVEQGRRAGMIEGMRRAEVNWLPIAELPEAFKDGRELLFWCGKVPNIGAWDYCEGEGYWHMGPFISPDPTYFAEINPPASAIATAIAEAE